MDIISFNEASTANGRIESFIENPDSTSGVLTVPKTIAAGETITIPAGRVAILPDLQVDGTLNIEGEVFIPSGATFSKVVETAGNQTIDGVKTFSSSPIVPAPTTDNQVANKKYVDDNIEATWVANDNRVKTALNATGNAPIYACRAWVNFNGTGTVAIRASGNVSSITDNGVGQYTVNFTTAMPDANYSFAQGVNLTTDGGYPITINETASVPKTATALRVILRGQSSGFDVIDTSSVSIQIFR